MGQASNNEAWEIDEEEIRLRILKEIDNGMFSEDALNAQFNDLSVFKNGEEYDFVTDLHRGYQDSLKKSTAEAIFETLPDHVFWDIKKPLGKDQINVKNNFNPFRQHPFTSFFDYTSWEEYSDMRLKKENVKDATSKYRLY